LHGNKPATALSKAIRESDEYNPQIFRLGPSFGTAPGDPRFPRRQAFLAFKRLVEALRYRDRGSKRQYVRLSAWISIEPTMPIMMFLEIAECPSITVAL
jgi:hypothetical protein